jgi:hypothetical protein
MVAADGLRGAALALVPILALAGHLSITVLYVVVALVGTGTVLFDVAQGAFIVSLIGRDRLLQGNSLVVATSACSETIGPGLAGLLVQALGAAQAVAGDAVSYVVSAATVLAIRSRGPRLRSAPGARPLDDARDGLRKVRSDAVLSRLAGSTALGTLGSGMVQSMYYVLAYRVLHLSPLSLGIVLILGNSAALLGASAASRLNRIVPLGVTLPASFAFTNVAMAMAALATLGQPLVLYGLAAVGVGISQAAFNVTQVALRQSRTSDDLLGRMTATMRTLAWGSRPVGALLGGLVGATLGPAWAIVAGAGAGLAGVLFLLSWPADAHLGKARSGPVHHQEASHA